MMWVQAGIGVIVIVAVVLFVGSLPDDWFEQKK